MEKEMISVCAWCPDKDEKTIEAEQNWNEVTHTICKACEEVQEKAFNLLEK